MDSLVHLGRVGLLPFLERNGQELCLDVHINALLEPFDVHEIQFTQLHTDADSTGRSRHSLDVQHLHILQLFELLCGDYIAHVLFGIRRTVLCIN